MTFEKKVLRKMVSKFENSIFENNDFSVKNDEI